MGLSMLLFWIAAVIVVIIVLRNFWGPQGVQPLEKGNPALDILNERYARGELNREEYEQKKRDIQNQEPPLPPPPPPPA